MLRTCTLVQSESKNRACKSATDWRVVSIARVHDPEPKLSRLGQLETELDAVRRALALAKSEIVAIQSAEKSARYLAMHDALTSLPNLRYFRLRLERAMMTGALYSQLYSQPSFAMLYFDLDGFKQLNDAHGHHFGDGLLRIVAARLAHAVRAEDFVSRLGGDEFACLIAGKPRRDQLTRLANNLYDAVRAPLRVDGHDLEVCVSIGIAIAPDDGQNADELMRHADMAMYRAKRDGTGCEFYSANHAA